MAVHIINTKTNLLMDRQGLLHALPQDTGVCIECGETAEYLDQDSTKLATVLPSNDDRNPTLLDL